MIVFFFDKMEDYNENANAIEESRNDPTSKGATAFWVLLLREKDQQSKTSYSVLKTFMYPLN